MLIVACRAIFHLRNGASHPISHIKTVLWHLPSLVIVRNSERHLVAACNIYSLVMSVSVNQHIILYMSRLSISPRTSKTLKKVTHSPQNMVKKVSMAGLCTHPNTNRMQIVTQLSPPTHPHRPTSQRKDCFGSKDCGRVKVQLHSYLLSVRNDRTQRH